MDDKSVPWRPYADLAVVTGKYVKDGKEKNRYKNIGVLFATPHFSHMFIKLDTLPMDGKISVFKRDDATQQAPDKVYPVEEGKPVDLGDIPF